MIHLFDKYRRAGQACGFVKADLSETTEYLVNPDRGVYQIYPFVLGEQPDYERLAECILPSERLAHVIINIAGYVQTDLPEDALVQMREILDFFVRSGKDIILRVVYDNEGRAMEKEPGLFGRVSGHLEQIAALAAEYGERLFVYQGLLIGNWGEMHGSRYLNEKYMASLMGLLRDRIRGEVFLAVRTPEQLKKVTACAEWEEKAFRQMSLFDDAILGSENDCGTYSADEREREVQIAFVQKIAANGPVGGEAVCGDGYALSQTPEAVIQYLSKMRVTYLNRQHDMRVIENWKTQNYQGRNLYEYIADHLGYRYLVTDVRKKPGVPGEMTLYLKNTGFAPVYRRTESLLLWESGDGTAGEIPLELDLRHIQGQEILAVPIPAVVSETVERPLKWFLLTRRRFDGAVIRFANRQTQDGRVYLGEW